ncbi:hypothetical protein T10_3664 [Trichinella papuae]|uniref:Uncharacterized protein n=1 Tax=Trichinella papuae TaxID=268474 RepID=A0A0V1ML26_9BILA|nr:hypothetical protein T10_3664 [Trichinella papuae]
MRRCKQEVGLRQHRFRDSRLLAQTDQLVQTCLGMQNIRFRASTAQHCVRITQNLKNAPDSPFTSGNDFDLDGLCISLAAFRQLRRFIRQRECEQKRQVFAEIRHSWFRRNAHTAKLLLLLNNER